MLFGGWAMVNTPKKTNYCVHNLESMSQCCVFDQVFALWFCCKMCFDIHVIDL